MVQILLVYTESDQVNGGTLSRGDRGGTVVKVLCYKSEGRWFDSRWCHWNFSFFQSHYACNRNEYQENFLEVKAAGA